MSEQRKQYRSWTAAQKVAIVLAGLRGDRSVKDVCREHQISDTLYYSWRDKLLEAEKLQLVAEHKQLDVLQMQAARLRTNAPSSARKAR